MNTPSERIKGHRELDDQDITAINLVKETESVVEQIIEQLEAGDGPRKPDPRWIAIARTDLQKGFMALTRSVAMNERAINTKEDFEMNM